MGGMTSGRSPWHVRPRAGSVLLFRIVIVLLCIWIGSLVVEGITVALTGAPVVADQSGKAGFVR